MQRYTRLELAVGVFVLVGAAAVSYLAFTLGRLSLGEKDRYPISARFSSVGDLKVGDPVKMAGVTVGEVTRIVLADFVAEAQFIVDQGVPVPDDTIASIQTNGLLGDAYVSLSPGASETDLKANGRITRTEPAISITEMIAKYAFGSPMDDGAAVAPSGSGEDSADSTAKSPFSDPLE